MLLPNKPYMNLTTTFNMEKKVHIAIVPGVGYSHLVPILQFFKRLVQLHPDFNVHCFIPTLGSPSSASKTILETLPSNINFTFLPPVNPNDLPIGTTLEMQLQLTLNHSLPSIHQALKSLTLRTPIVALVVDSFAVEVLNFAQEFNMLSYIYYPGAATTLSLSFYLPKLDEETSCEYRDLSEPVKVPGCVPLHGRDLYAPVQDRLSQAYKLVLQRVKRFRFVDGILVNSFLELEVGPIRALTEEGSGYPPVYPVGPIIQMDLDPLLRPAGSVRMIPASAEPFCSQQRIRPLIQIGTRTRFDDNPIVLKCMTWLDKQQPCSVLYVSFGSGGTLSQEQIVELALGLEQGNHKFLWVVRAPSSSASGVYLSAENSGNPLEFLPSGFLERTKEQGLVIASWAPQIQILSHNSIGGFLSHCGWNSILESVVFGVPLITWPLFAEQIMNAVLLSEGLKVGLRPRVGENGIVARVEVVEIIKCLMEGEEGGKLRNNMKELKEAATNALKEDGHSTETISQLTLKWKSLV